jgi:MOSC domain-containing protein YiiM
LISIQVGIPRTVTRDGQEVTTGIYKAPIKGRVQLHSTNLEGDKQADRSVHGGQDKAVSAYPSEHYSYWKKELSGVDLPWGAFGENFTTEGLTEDTVCLGDRFTIGTAVHRSRRALTASRERSPRAEVVVTQPHSLLQVELEIWQ